MKRTKVALKEEWHTCGGPNGRGVAAAIGRDPGEQAKPRHFSLMQEPVGSPGKNPGRRNRME